MLRRHAAYEVAVACAKASAFEWRFGVLDDPDEYEDKCDAEECEATEAEYKAALIWLKRKVPELKLVPSELVKGVHADATQTRQCPCGAGRLSVYPWVLQVESLGFCMCEEAQYELICWRSEWIDAGAPGIRY